MLVLQLWFSESSNWQSRASIWWPCVARISCSVEMTGRASSNFCFKPTPQVCCVGVDHVLLRALSNLSANRSRFALFHNMALDVGVSQGIWDSRIAIL